VAVVKRIVAATAARTLHLFSSASVEGSRRKWVHPRPPFTTDQEAQQDSERMLLGQKCHRHSRRVVSMTFSEAVRNWRRANALAWSLAS